MRHGKARNALPVGKLCLAELHVLQIHVNRHIPVGERYDLRGPVRPLFLGQLILANAGDLLFCLVDPAMVGEMLWMKSIGLQMQEARHVHIQCVYAAGVLCSEASSEAF